MGIIGQYLSKIYLETKKTSIYNMRNRTRGKLKGKNMNQKTIRKLRVKRIIILFVVIILIIIGLIIYFKVKEDNRRKDLLIKKEKRQQEILRQEELKNNILNHYNKYVITDNVIDIYTVENNEFIKNGSIGKGQILELKELEVTYKDQYLPISTFEGYYVYYEDINKTEEIDEIEQRYKNYIPYNENIITNEDTNFYDMYDNLVYSFNRSFNLPIIIKDNDKYGIEYNNRLLYVKKKMLKK